MLSAAKEWVEDKAAGLLKTGIQAGGTLAGNAVGGVGSMIESGGTAVGQGVAGGIGGVGNRINGYGDGIKRSMSADGPVSNVEKKTAVKPSTSVGKTAPPVKKTVPSTAGVQKGATTAQKSGLVQTPARQAAKTGGAAETRSKTAASQTRQSRVSGLSKPGSGIVPAARTTAKRGGPIASTNNSKPATSSAKPQSKSSGDGKTRISPESRPMSGNLKSTAVSAPGHPTAAIKKPSQPQSASTRKASAADPLALGEEIGNIGKKK